MTTEDRKKDMRKASGALLTFGGGFAGAATVMAYNTIGINYVSNAEKELAQATLDSTNAKGGTVITPLDTIQGGPGVRRFVQNETTYNTAYMQQRRDNLSSLQDSCMAFQGLLGLEGAMLLSGLYLLTGKEMLAKWFGGKKKQQVAPTV